MARSVARTTSLRRLEIKSVGRNDKKFGTNLVVPDHIAVRRIAVFLFNVSSVLNTRRIIDTLDESSEGVSMGSSVAPVVQSLLRLPMERGLFKVRTRGEH